MRILVIATFFLMLSGAARAQESSVYLMGSGGSFSPLLPAKGFAGKSITGWYWAGKYADANGDKADVTNNIYGFYQQFMVHYVTGLEVLGAKYTVGAMLPFATAEKNQSGSIQIRERLFMADPYISPIGFSWQKPNYQIFAEYRLYLPWGQYNPDELQNVGKGHYSHIISLSTTYFLDQFKKWSFTLLPRYEFHGERKESNVKAGSYFNLEWAFTNSEHRKLDFGLVGYSSFQLTQDTGSGVPPGTAEVLDRVVAIGAECGILASKINTRFAIRSNFEVYGVDRPIGTMLHVRYLLRPRRHSF